MLFICNTCGKMSRVNNDMITDWNKQVIIKGDKAICPSCDNLTDYKIIKCEDWIEDLVFSIKGN